MAFKTVCQNNKCSVIITIIIIKTVINCHRPVFSSCTLHSFFMHLDLLPGFGGLRYLPPHPLSRLVSIHLPPSASGALYSSVSQVLGFRIATPCPHAFICPFVHPIVFIPCFPSSFPLALPWYFWLTTY